MAVVKGRAEHPSHTAAAVALQPNVIKWWGVAQEAAAAVELQKDVTPPGRRAILAAHHNLA